MFNWVWLDEARIQTESPWWIICWLRYNSQSKNGPKRMNFNWESKCKTRSKVGKCSLDRLWSGMLINSVYVLGGGDKEMLRYFFFKEKLLFTSSLNFLYLLRRCIPVYLHPVFPETFLTKDNVYELLVVDFKFELSSHIELRKLSQATHSALLTFLGIWLHLELAEFFFISSSMLYLLAFSPVLY